MGWSVTHDTAEQNHTTVYFTVWGHQPRDPSPSSTCQQRQPLRVVESQGRVDGGVQAEGVSKGKVEWVPHAPACTPHKLGGVGVCWPRL